MTVRAIVRPEPMALSYSEGLVAPANLLSDEPKSVAVSQGGAQPYAVFALPAPTLIDTIFFGFVAAADAVFEGLGFTAGADTGAGLGVIGNTAALTTQVQGGRRHAVLTLAAPITTSLITIRLTRAGAFPAGLSIGKIAVGRAFRPQWGGEWGGGVGLTDTGTATRRRDGGFGIDPGVSAAQMQWTFGDLSDAERAQLFGMLKRRGATTQPFLVIEGGDNGPSSTEEVHWGLFTRIEPYERQAPGMSRWSLRFEDWE
ncbi:MAG: hypothetical protein K2X76_15350 [Sphingomonas sp.]|nr:hypothetical protein [Sphingomonas sp.]